MTCGVAPEQKVFVDPSPGRRVFVDHAGCFQEVSPFAASARMAVLQMLSEVVCSKEFLGRVALPELVHFLEVLNALIPVLIRDRPRTTARAVTRPGEILAAVSAGVGLAWASR
jgi:hypothetical protein